MRRLAPSPAAGAEPGGAGEGRGHLHTEGLSWGSLFGRETTGLALGSRAVLRARGEPEAGCCWVLPSATAPQAGPIPAAGSDAEPRTEMFR